jgi:phenylalanyl-tRNA synthetase beta chain
MTISYNWLCTYLPERPEPEKLSRILTAIGLEVESMEKYASVKGGLKGLVVGEVLEVEKHPNADKLSVTKVTVGGDPLQIVCGAPNVAVGQKVVVATVGTTIYPLTGDPLTMKLAKIRSVESHGMICAEDEIGLGESHDGILVLKNETAVGTAAADYFGVYEDIIFEIGLTPNRMDAMSHMGVARDVMAYLHVHEKKDARLKTPSVNGFRPDNQGLQISVTVENEEACPRYAGITLSGIKVAASPKWLQDALKSIGLRPINNVVDITNYVLHETGHPLHAFNADAITGNAIVVKNMPADTVFTTLDGKERKLAAEDLMICNAEEPMCIAGVYGGLHSGVTETTTNIFIESAWFSPASIRPTSIKHGLRTDAATRFEKGVDISQSVYALKRAATLIKEIAGGEISSDVIDVYPHPKEKTEVGLKNHYLKKLSGKNYHPDTVKKILESLGFEIMKEGIDELRVAVPHHKPDISLPADIVEEIIRIDGLDNIEIPAAITISPATDEHVVKAALQEKVANYLAGLGFHEIFTNSITNSAFYSEEMQPSLVKMLNSLSVELDVMRPSLLETGLQSVAYNLNRKNTDLQFFEFGNIYRNNGVGQYEETAMLCLYLTGNARSGSWKEKAVKTDFFLLKGITGRILQQMGIKGIEFANKPVDGLENSVEGSINGMPLCTLGAVSRQKAEKFDIKQPVFYAAFNWGALITLAQQQEIVFKEIARFPSVQRDLALVVSKTLPYSDIEKTVRRVKLDKLQSLQLFDIFESDKLGVDKQSMAISLTFLDNEKTLTDKEIDAWMQKITGTLEKELGAEIRGK